eukprot:CAMPEP_0174262338 /NCGR_PEP_ID=MMETSP0439-20130205/12918_1 /TAXON_ID=0 /ORGANISM="Stereomyxa ramosa, Strain Chinc5" /LENGTH=337 /DNA_ID=CAMNT_0015347033 /DNA_START=209 /DNA_END=1222 /DNA_ORIENTATION=-
MKECEEKVWEKREKIDVVIPWINWTETGYFYWPLNISDRRVNKNPYAGIGHNRPPNSEVIFGLRSLVKHGMMPYINKIYILYDDNRQGPPQFLKRNQDKVRGVPHSELTGGTRFLNSVLMYEGFMSFLHHLHGLSDFFFLMHDDMFLMEPFDVSFLFNISSGKIVGHLGGGTFWPESQRGLNILAKDFGERYRLTDSHVPFVLSRCLLEEQEARYGEELFRCSEGTKPPVCHFDYHWSSFSQNYAIDRGVSVNTGASGGYGSEIHLNGMRSVSSKTLIQMLQRLEGSTQWLNVQGDGISDEYVQDNVRRVILDDWLFETFPEKAFWENDWEDLTRME